MPRVHRLEVALLRNNRDAPRVGWCMKPYSSQIEETMRALRHCHQTCLGMAMTHCLEMGGAHARPQHLRLMMDCAQICATTADFLARKSQFHNHMCGFCADVCETCATDCENIGDMRASVDACRACVAACRQAARLDHAEILKMASELPPS